MLSDIRKNVERLRKAMVLCDFHSVQRQVRHFWLNPIKCLSVGIRLSLLFLSISWIIFQKCYGKLSPHQNGVHPLVTKCYFKISPTNFERCLLRVAIRLWSANGEMVLMRKTHHFLIENKKLKFIKTRKCWKCFLRAKYYIIIKKDMQPLYSWLWCLNFTSSSNSLSNS